MSMPSQARDGTEIDTGRRIGPDAAGRPEGHRAFWALILPSRLLGTDAVRSGRTGVQNGRI